MERNFVDRVIQHRRDTAAKEEREVSHARAASGVPAPGQSLFSGGQLRKPTRG